MIPVKKLKIVPVEELKIGDFAIYPAMNNAPVAVSSYDGTTILISLGGHEPAFDWFRIDNLPGNAIVIAGAEVEIDPWSHSENNLGLGCLIRMGTQLQVLAHANHGSISIPLMQGLETVSYPRAYFGRWRVVVRDDDREFVLASR